MFNGKFIATRDWDAGEWFTKGKVYEFKDGIVIYDDGWYDYRPFESLEGFEECSPDWEGILIPYVEPNPEPAFKRGDWVQLTANTDELESMGIERGLDTGKVYQIDDITYDECYWFELDGYWVREMFVSNIQVFTPYESIDFCEGCNSDPTTTIEVDDGEYDQMMTLTFQDDERRVNMTVTRDVGFLSNMIESFVQFLGHIGFDRQTIYRFMREHLDENDI